MLSHPIPHQCGFSLPPVRCLCVSRLANYQICILPGKENLEARRATQLKTPGERQVIKCFISAAVSTWKCRSLLTSCMQMGWADTIIISPVPLLASVQKLMVTLRKGLPFRPSNIKML